MKLFTALDYVTSDDYVLNTGDTYFYDKHYDIVKDMGDWSWNEILKYWDEVDLDDALSIYKVDHDL
jgi:hypothetical protein